MHNCVLKSCLILIFALLFSSESGAQLNNSYRYYYPEFKKEHANQLLLHVANINFVKNNEYKNHLVWGHSLLGYDLQPSLMYYAGDRLRVRAGVFLQQYSGRDYYSKIKPVLSAHLRLSPSVEIITGSLSGHIHHRVIEPLFDSERQYIRPVENGLQFLVNRPWLRMDTWVDWEQFIRPGDQFPEWFTAGTSAEAEVLKDVEKKWEVNLPVNIIAVHRGGEVSDYPEKVQTALNLAAGMKAEKELDGWLKRVELWSYIMSYSNLNDIGPRGVNNGSAWYAGTTLDTRRTNWMMGYFHGYNFVALRGSGMFQSLSPIRDDFYRPYRELITSKVAYNRSFLEKIKFSFLLETYYDMKDNQLDFAAGVQLVFNPTFFITEAEFF